VGNKNTANRLPMPAYRTKNELAEREAQDMKKNRTRILIKSRLEKKKVKNWKQHTEVTR
jgi:hypothetical protein